MKTILKITSLIILTISVFGCCKKDTATPSPNNQCTETTNTNSRSINLIDITSGSAYYNQAVATFQFVQAHNTYSGSVNCPLEDCSVALTLHNNTSKKITFDYNIIFQLNFASWNYQGYATIPANSSLAVGQINSSCASVSLGAFTIQSASISYN